MRLLTPYWANKSLAPAFDSLGDVEKFFDGFPVLTPRKVYSELSFEPASEVTESDSNFLLSLDLPGIKKDEIKIEVHNNILTISGERKRESRGGDQDSIQTYEKSYGSFKRSFTLPTSIDADGILASYQDGVLELTLPKSQASKPRQIEIQSSKRVS